MFHSSGPFVPDIFTNNWSLCRTLGSITKLIPFGGCLLDAPMDDRVFFCVCQRCHHSSFRHQPWGCIVCDQGAQAWEASDCQRQGWAGMAQWLSSCWDPMCDSAFQPGLWIKQMPKWSNYLLTNIAVMSGFRIIIEKLSILPVAIWSVIVMLWMWMNFHNLEPLGALEVQQESDIALWIIICWQVDKLIAENWMAPRKVLLRALESN